MPDDLFNLLGRTLADKYAIEAQVAAGGFGVVYRARHTELETPVAIKVLHVARGADAESRARFLRDFKKEAQLIARIDHPAVARVLNFGVSEMPDGDRAPWMALEWVEGQTLKADLVARRGKGGRGPRECLTLLRPILEALAQAHEDGIAHRDIKPANMILTAPRAATASLDGKVRRAGAIPLRLLDFGIAKIMQPDEELPSGGTSTSAEALQFTTVYAAPEQVGTKRTGPWTDVRALGLVLIEMLTDQRAYPGADNVELLRHIVALERPTPRNRFSVDVGAWESVLARAMAASTSERYGNAGELLSALEANVPANVERVSTTQEVRPRGRGDGARNRARTSGRTTVALTIAPPEVAAPVAPDEGPPTRGRHHGRRSGHRRDRGRRPPGRETPASTRATATHAVATSPLPPAAPLASPNPRDLEVSGPPAEKRV